MIFATCPYCQKKYELTDDYTKTAVVCNFCNNNFFKRIGCVSHSFFIRMEIDAGRVNIGMS